MSRAPNAADRARGWPKLMRETEGMLVRLRRDTGNGLAVAPAGTVGHIENSNGWDLLRFRSDPCKCCGVAVRISRMSWRDLEPIV